MEGKDQDTRLPIHLLKFNTEGNLLALVVANHIYIYSFGAENFVEEIVTADSTHKDLIRGIAWNGDQLVSGGDDKQVKLWQISSSNFKCLASSPKNPKKITSLTFAKLDDQDVILFADKFGEVWSVPVNNLQTEKPTLLLGHVSIITDLAVPPSNEYVLSADRDEKIRVSHLPKAYDIQSFCLGHTEFVSKIIIPENYPELVVSGSGDQTLRLWNYVTGECVFSCRNHASSAGNVTIPAAYYPPTSILAVIVEGDGLHLYRVSASQLQHLSQLEMAGAAPLAAQFDVEGNLWVSSTDGSLRAFAPNTTSSSSSSGSSVPYEAIPQNGHKLSTALKKINETHLSPSQGLLAQPESTTSTQAQRNNISFSKKDILEALAFGQYRKKTHREGKRRKGNEKRKGKEKGQAQSKDTSEKHPQEKTKQTS
jgi:tRNA (guanine-N(7)-)-methyltransferase subunit TRM82